MRRDAELHYRICAYDRLDPFLMTLASDTDLWLFISSGGGLTAGRVDPDGSLFPYETADRLHDAHHQTGPLTLIRVEDGDERGGGPGRDARGEAGCGATSPWRPFAETVSRESDIERNLDKAVAGNSLLFEEIHHDLGLAFRYRWAGCDEFGWVRTATLENRSARPVRVHLLDGLRNVLPFGAPLSLYQQASNLVDAYKMSEVDPETGLAIFSLTAGITDRPEALEVLRANTVWSCGLETFRVQLSRRAVVAFRDGRILAGETVLKGARGNYFLNGSLDLEPGESSQWHIAADAGRDHLQIAALRRRLLSAEDLAARIGGSLQQATDNLRRNVASADGLQLTGRTEAWTHHFANVLFNNMRGGVFLQNHDVPVADFAEFLRARNRAVAHRQRARLSGLPVVVTVQELRRQGRQSGDPDYERICHEYLPLHFGRRHGDPSRPWNRFAIRVRDGQGRRTLNYEGNWRDIFQNWEALGTAFPGFLPSIVAKFVNGSTVDGFNPYRIMREGVEWEVIAPEDPWSNIGYWGDHQIVYLLRLLEALESHDPGALGQMLGAEIFSYAAVPYRLAPYRAMLQEPGATIAFDAALDRRIGERVQDLGADGKLLTGTDGSVYHANLLEKLLVPALAKLSNLVPEGGIWMNTQRPEWNDANNALAGRGLSVVTLCHLRRYLDFLSGLLARTSVTRLPISREVIGWLDGVAAALASAQGPHGAVRLDARERKALMDALGEAFSRYRLDIYSRGFSGKEDLPLDRIGDLCRSALPVLDRTIALNRRQDGLFHTYNLLRITGGGSGVEVDHLQEMLEGQVAALAAGVLAPAESAELLDRLFASALYRPDQRSFLLYPRRDPPGFLRKNTVPQAQARGIGLLADLLQAGDRSLIARDEDGILRFQGDLQSGDDVGAVLNELGAQERWAGAVARDRHAVIALFEKTFSHDSYTGRSGVMFGYEGQGCIYWHMVAKLLLAVQETFLRAEDQAGSAAAGESLARMYFRIRSGLGYRRSVAEYGAFPIDPYSHTPAGGGAKQPGLTGQVKEEILTRRGELGITIEAGTVSFRPRLLSEGEFLSEAGEFRAFDTTGQERTLRLPAGSLAFTLCEVPVIYELSQDGPRLRIVLADGRVVERPGCQLDGRLSAELLARSGRIDLIRHFLPRDSVLS